MRDRRRFYDPTEFASARETISNCLELVSAASSEPVSYNIAPIAYDVANIDPQSMKDLLRITANPNANLFAEYWDSEIFPQVRRSAPDLTGITITNQQQIIPGLISQESFAGRATSLSWEEPFTAICEARSRQLRLFWRRSRTD